MTNIFDKKELKSLYRPDEKSSGEDNGQVTIIGGSKLFHGAPIFALKIASRIVDMVFFATPEPGVGKVAEQIKSELLSFIWISWEDTEKYIEKSDAILIGPGFMRFGSEATPEEKRGFENHKEGKLTRDVTKNFLDKFPDKKWVIDAGSLQVMDVEWIPKGAVLTPNRKEFQMLFGVDASEENVEKIAQKHQSIVVLKGPETIVASPEKTVLVDGGNPGMTKGGTGDVLAGLTVALLAKNDAFLAASSASFVIKKAADELHEKVGVNYNSDDLTTQVPETLQKLLK